MSIQYSINPRTEWDRKIGKFIILETFICTWKREQGLGGGHIHVHVHAGFETDFASIPRIARSIVPVIGKHIQPAIVHDYCYENVIPEMPDMTKKDADTLFLEGMIYCKVNWARRNVMYRSVRIGGKGRF